VRRLAPLRLRPIFYGMKGEGDDDRYSEEETARRAEEVIKRMLNTPPQPRKAKLKPKAKERPPSKGRVRKGKSRS